MTVEQAMARLHPLCRLPHSRGQHGEGAPCWRGIRQHLQHHCADGEKPADSHTSCYFDSRLPSVLQMQRLGERWSASFIRACSKA